jgi:hypothetical protein
MSKKAFKNGRPRGRRSGPARIIKSSKLRRLASIFRLPMFRKEE